MTPVSGRWSRASGDPPDLDPTNDSQAVIGVASLQRRRIRVPGDGGHPNYGSKEPTDVIPAAM